jgi:hypothetical protein
MTLRELVDRHPDWLDFDIVVYRSDGQYDYVGDHSGVPNGAGSVYLDEEGSDPLRPEGPSLVVFAGN